MFGKENFTSRSEEKIYIGARNNNRYRNEHNAQVVGKQNALFSVRLGRLREVNAVLMLCEFE